MSELDEVIGEFLVESYENLDRLDQDLVALEDNPTDRQLLSGIFRTIHTIKGTCGFLGYSKLESLTHAGENLLSRLRDGELTLNAQIATALLSMVDSVRAMLSSIEATQDEGNGDYSALTITLHDLCEGSAAENPEVATEQAGSSADENPTEEQAASPARPDVLSGETSDVPSDAPSGETSDAPSGEISDARPAKKKPKKSGFATNMPDTNMPDADKSEAKPKKSTFATNVPDTEPAEEKPKKSTFATNVPDADKSEAKPKKSTFATNVPDADKSEAKPKKSTFATNVPDTEPAPAAAKAPVAPEPAPVATSAPTPVAEKPAAPAAAQHPQNAPAEAGSHAADTTIRVDVSLLDTLMNLVGELVLARNQIVQVTGAYGESDLVAAAQRLNLITSELQEGVMKTRMQPIGNVLSKFPRVVRDIAVQLGKQVRIDLEGKETELDKTINEAIKDPLTHLVRNSVDHGIEMPDVRVAKGKRPEGHVILRAFHEGGQVNIEIQDDGAGIDAAKLKEKALEKGLVTQSQAERMSEREALMLIFMPGFSTAEKVSNISGRGVGMDVVKTNIESIGGAVDIHTVLGRGTTIKIKIPLTLAIIPALLVSTRNDRYAIPQVSLLELLRLEGEAVRTGIEMIHGAPVYRLRGNLLPLCHLDHELWDESSAPWQGPSGDERVVNIVVLQADGRQFGLVVDEINDTQEIVVKPLEQQLKGIGAFAGATIMGDGRVALILDVLGLAQKAHVISEARDRQMADEEAARAAQDVQLTETLLLVQVGDRRVAVPLSLVSRLEEFQRDIIENSNGRSVVQYRDEIMPLVNVAYSLGAGPGEFQGDDQSLHVVVYSSNNRSMGLLVDDILDIVEEAISTGDAQPGTGVRGSAVIQGKVTDIVDVVELVRSIDPTFFLVGESEETEMAVQ